LLAFVYTYRYRYLLTFLRTENRISLYNEAKMFENKKKQYTINLAVKIFKKGKWGLSLLVVMGSNLVTI